MLFIYCLSILLFLLTQRGQQGAALTKKIDTIEEVEKKAIHLLGG